MAKADPTTGGDPDRALDDASFVTLYRRLVAAARVSFASFLHVIHPQNESPSYIIGPLHEYLADIVEGVMAGTLPPRQAISVPPQHGKSRMMCVRAVAWMVGRYPNVSIAMTGCNHTLLTTFLKEVRTLMRTPAYRRVFPGIEAVFGRDRYDDVEFNNGASIICRSAGSKLIGRRVDVLLIDDAHPGRAEAESALQRRRVIEWYFADCVTRLSKDAKIFLIGTRWHPQDLIGHLTSDDYVAQLRAEGQAHLAYQVTKLKAISDGIDDPLGRAEGEPLFPEERPLSFLLGMKASIPGYEWSSLYDQEPRAAASGQADLSRLTYIEPDDLPDSLTITRGWDTAVTEKKVSDFSAGALCGVDKATGQFYIIDIFKRQWAWTKMRPKITSLAKSDRALFNALRLAIEGTGQATALVQEIQQDLLGEVKVTRRNPPKGGKLLRAQPWLNLIEAGKVTLVRGAWNKEFLEELETFPEGIHDDQVDSVSIAYEDLFLKHAVALIA